MLFVIGWAMTGAEPFTSCLRLLTFSPCLCVTQYGEKGVDRCLYRLPARLMTLVRFP